MNALGYVVPDAQLVEVRRQADGYSGVYIDGERVPHVVAIGCSMSVDQVLQVTITIHARDFRVVQEAT